MPLDKYRDKRNFTSSPEPQGDDRLAKKRSAKSERFFCVQKHLATSLHYDFRLEHNGVLLSWAVPKGPSLNPADKRLAMHVEDHPLEYGTFEGVIPEGYGAGVVMLWDQGTWIPEVDDVDAALEKGDLKFRLEGFKLKGSWVLVRTRGWGGGSKSNRGSKASDSSRSWLLIKHKDEWAGPIDITTFAPNSVKSGGTFRDILMQEAPDVWRSHAPGSGPQGVDSLRKIAEKVIALEESEGGATPSEPNAPETRARTVRKTTRKAVTTSGSRRTAAAKGAPPKARTAKR